MLVSQILKSKSDDGVVTLPPETPLSKVAELLSTRRIGCIVISTDGKLVLGILSERDIVREMGRRGAACLAETAGTMMTVNVFTCSRHDMADDVLQMMTDNRFRHLPVVEEGQMIGLISLGDVVKARLGELSMEKNALERMVKGY